MATTAPGILWVNSGITAPNLTDEAFNTWYDETHIPDVLKTSAMKSAFRYRSIDPTAKTPYLALYPVKDVSWLESQEFASIPTNMKVVGDGKSEEGPCFDFAHFDGRIYEFVDSYEKPGSAAGPANLVISAALTPASGTDDDFHAWYKEEHFGTVAECKGYVRTRRYKLRKAMRPDASPPTYLALHEFEGESPPDAELQRTAETEWSKKIMGSLEGSEVGVYKIRGAFGDVKAKF